MNYNEIEHAIKAAVEMEWPAFEASHPNLARLLDQQMLTEHAAESLTSDPAFRNALHNAIANERGPKVLVDAIKPLVKHWIDKLF